MMHAFRKPWLVALAVALLSACAPAPSAQEIQAQIGTGVALTVAAQDAQTAAAQPAATMTLTPTTVPFELPSMTPILPSATPFVISPPSSGGGGGGAPVPTTKPPQYACDVVYQKPEDGTTFKSGDPFDVKWTLKNVGTKNWEADFHFYFFKGEPMSPNPLVYLGKTVKPGGTVTFGVDANAPINTTRDPVLYIMWFALEGKGSKFCTPFIAIYSKKPGT
jgi:hypothetical protein